MGLTREELQEILGQYDKDMLVLVRTMDDELVKIDREDIAQAEVLESHDFYTDATNLDQEQRQRHLNRWGGSVKRAVIIS